MRRYGMLFQTKKKKGFTLVEMITVLAILAVSMGTFYTVFFLNWESFDHYIARADLGQELDQVMDKVADDGRFARQINITSNATAKQAVFIDPDGNVLGIYTMKNTGEFVINRGKDDYVASKRVDFLHSNFEKRGKSVLLTLALTDLIWNKSVTLSSSTEIYPRN